MTRDSSKARIILPDNPGKLAGAGIRELTTALKETSETGEPGLNNARWAILAKVPDSSAVFPGVCGTIIVANALIPNR